MRPSPPPDTALRAFGVLQAEPLMGGQGESWQAHGLVFKPNRATAELEWLESLPVTTSVRTARPVRSDDGRLLVDGWSAMPYLVGTHAPGRWRDIAEAGRSLSRELNESVEPEWMRSRADAWAEADRIAWEDEPLPKDAPRWLHALAERRTPLDQPRTLIHGDLTGNVLFDHGLPPAVIDLSLYFRPTEYAVAIIVVDAVCFEGAPAHIRQLLTDVNAEQLLLRAILFRAATDLVRHGAVAKGPYAPAIALLDPER